MNSVRLAWLRVAAILFDALALLLTWFGTVHLRADLGALPLFAGLSLAPVHPGRALPLGALLIPLWLLALHRVGSYGALRRKTLPRLLREVSGAACLGLIASLAALFLLRIEPASRSLLLGYSALTVPILLASRQLQAATLRALRRRAFDPHRVLVVGEAPGFFEAVARHDAWGIEARPVAPASLTEALMRGPVDEVYLAGTPDPDQVLQTARLCDELGVRLSLDANFLGLQTHRADLVDYDGWNVLTFSSAPARPLELGIKRALDLILASVGLVLATPLLAFAAWMIHRHDGGPVLFVQERVGRHGRPFQMYKLRTMVVGAEQHQPHLPNDADGPAFKMRADPRITPVGRWLRRLSIDELPQLFNVLRGEMSLVGPRPPLPREVARYARWQLRRLSVKPGLTCTWQVSGRSDIGFEQWMMLDLEYIDNWSLWLDLRLLAATVPAVLRGTGAR